METTNVVPEHYNSNQLVTYKVIDGDSITYPTEKVVTIEYALDHARTLSKDNIKLRDKIDTLESELCDWLENETSTEDIVSRICEIFGFNPTKEIEFEATVNVTGTLSVPLSQINEFDINDAIEVEVTSYGYDVDANADIDYIGVV